MSNSISQVKVLPIMVFLSGIFPYVGPLELGTQPVFPMMFLLYALSHMTYRVIVGAIFGVILTITQVFWVSWEVTHVPVMYIAMATLLGVFAFLYLPMAQTILREQASMGWAVKISRSIILFLLIAGLISQDLMVSVNEIFISEIRGTHLNSMWFLVMEPGHGAFCILSFFLLSYMASSRNAILFDTVLSIVCLALIKTLTASICLLFLLYFVYLKREQLLKDFGKIGRMLTMLFVLGVVSGGVAVGTSSGIANARINQLQNYEEMEGSSPAIRILQLVFTVEKVVNMDFYEHVGGAPAVGVYSYVDRFPLVTAAFIISIFISIGVVLKVVAMAYIIMLPVLTPFLFIFIVFSVFHKTRFSRAV